jgi:hypothetical protein
MAAKYTLAEETAVVCFLYVSFIFIEICTVDEYEFEDGRLLQTLRFPLNSGPVSCVACLPSGKHLIW